MSAFSRWGSVCHHVELGVSRFIPSTPTERISKAGGYITLRAEEDLLIAIAISNCPQERNPCNAFKPTRLRVVVEGAA